MVPTVPPEWAKCTSLLHHGTGDLWKCGLPFIPSSHLLAQLKLSGDFSSHWVLLQQVVFPTSSNSSTSLGSRGSTKHNCILEAQGCNISCFVFKLLPVDHLGHCSHTMQSRGTGGSKWNKERRAFAHRVCFLMQSLSTLWYVHPTCIIHPLINCCCTHTATFINYLTRKEPCVFSHSSHSFS